ncbi:conserved protein of unknown function [Georgfuchsia toluolica]|uniref:Translocation and assembly module TamB C-terminal domain-containing protein n=1 Tax=Georgfuchsia toluolica TaxID=424218 RepID=A0A916J9N5_9PROT|nr:translocation/assembly module TamB domain-containing protein [Georgfuchsia toluolica]CAG4884918.1 conserved protein of unknown function [Georgfuchsia toluolica]
MRRGFKTWSLAIALLFCALIAGAWWAASSSRALQWLVAEAVQRSNGVLEFEGVSGSLLGRVQVRKLTYAADDVRITLDHVVLEISQRALLQHRLDVVTLDAAAVDVHKAASGKPPQAPDSLALPFEIELSRVRIGQLRFRDQRIDNVAFRYRGGQAGHALQALVGDSEWGRVSGNMTIAGARPFAVLGRIELHRPGKWNAQAEISGGLLAADIAAHASARGARADAKVNIAPFERHWLRELHAHGEQINLAAFHSGLPQSLLGINVTGAGNRDEWPAGKVSITNATPGTITDNRLPLAKLSANYALQDIDRVVLDNIAADFGAGGTLNGTARIAPQASQLDLVAHALNLRALHAPLRKTHLNGMVRAELAGGAQKLQLDLAERGIGIALSASRRGDAVTLAEFRARAGAGSVRGNGKLSLAGPQPFAFNARISRLDPAAFGDYPAASITGQLSASGALVPQWRANVTLTLADSRFRGARLAGAASGDISSQGVRNLQLDLAVGTNTLHASGGYGRVGDSLVFALKAPQLAQLDTSLAGTMTAEGRVSGDAERPQFDIDVVGTALAWRQNYRIDALHLHASGSAAKHAATITAHSRDFDLEASVDGGCNAKSGWSGALASLRNRGAYPMQLRQPMLMAFSRGRYSAGPAQLDVADGRIALSSLLWQHGKLQTSGELKNLPVAPLLAIAGKSVPNTTLRVGGAWSISTSPLVNGQLTLARESGDIVTPGEAAVALGLDRLDVRVNFVKGALDASLDVHARTLSGNAHAAATSWSPAAKLKLDGRFDIASLQVFNPLLGSQALLRGSAAINITGGGTLAAPQFNGSLVVADLGVEAPQYGMRLHHGTLRAELDDKMLTLREFSIQGDEGTLSATGSMARTEGVGAHLAWRAEHLRVFNRSDMRLKFDGGGTVAIAEKKLVLRGSLTADEGRFEFDLPRAPRLASDIVVVGRSRATEQSALRASFQTRLLDVDVMLDVGNRFHIVGAGLDTDLHGKINLKTNARGVLEARGVLSSVNGVYFAFGQRLDIDRGRLIFDGPIDNPALDILAKRKGLAVEAGVAVTGSVLVPHVQLISDPPVPDSEKLAWLTLGHGLQDATGADLALLQTAAAALIGTGNAVPITQRIANRVGLDELSLKGGSEAGSQVAAVGKRLSSKLYLEYQQGIAAASSVLRLSYALTGSLSLRLDAGYTSGFGVYFTRSYD